MTPSATECTQPGQADTRLIDDLRRVHDLLPSLANMLMGDASSVPQIWPDDRYDVVWVVEDTGPGNGRGFRDVPKMLLAGDQPGPIHPAGPT